MVIQQETAAKRAWRPIGAARCPNSPGTRACSSVAACFPGAFVACGPPARPWLRRADARDLALLADNVTAPSTTRRGALLPDRRCCCCPLLQKNPLRLAAGIAAAGNAAARLCHHWTSRRRAAEETPSLQQSVLPGAPRLPGQSQRTLGVYAPARYIVTVKISDLPSASGRTRETPGKAGIASSPISVPISSAASDPIPVASCPTLSRVATTRPPMTHRHATSTASTSRQTASCGGTAHHLVSRRRRVPRRAPQELLWGCGVDARLPWFAAPAAPAARELLLSGGGWAGGLISVLFLGGSCFSSNLPETAALSRG